MCGIYLSIACSGDSPQPNSTLKERLHRRGPDAHGVWQHDRRVKARLEGTVLSLRGDHVVKQPLEWDVNEPTCFDPDGPDYHLCWNGEAWTVDGQQVTGSDTDRIMQLMMRTIQELRKFASRERGCESDYHVLDALSRVRGPYAFVLLDEFYKRVYFALDCLGRRSLLFRATGTTLELASVGDGMPGWKEVEANHVYVVDFGAPVGDVEQSLYDDKSLAQNVVVDIIRQSNVPFGVHALQMPWSRDLFAVNRDLPDQSVPILSESSEAVIRLEELLRHSIRLRLQGMKPGQDSKRARVAVLFSGGLDCSVLARIANDFLSFDEPIDLLNVAFHNPRIHGQTLSENDVSAYESCPDRKTAEASLKELRHACPDRTWRLVKINVPYDESQAHRDIVASLLQPHDTEMDLSIGLALYFAARGQGTVDGAEHITPARVLLSGLGADELFGGYQRHATAFHRGGYPALIAELALDTSRLGQRNLGRDDRVIANWSREARFPFLDEELVTWASQTPAWEKCGFLETSRRQNNELAASSMEPGKLVLRLVATKLGMPGVAREKKRAIQFGARTAKMVRGKTKGTDAIT